MTFEKIIDGWLRNRFGAWWMVMSVNKFNHNTTYLKRVKAFTPKGAYMEARAQGIAASSECYVGVWTEKGFLAGAKPYIRELDWEIA